MSMKRTTNVIKCDENGDPYRCQYCGGKVTNTDKRTGDIYREIWWTETPRGDEGMCIRCHEHYCRELDLVLSQAEWDAGECDGEGSEVSDE